jgi:Ca2+-binding RTX toxin-like protein
MATGTTTYYFGDSLTDVDVVYGAGLALLEAQILAALVAGLGPDPTPAQLAAAQAQAAAAAAAEAALLFPQFGPEQAVTNAFTHATYAGEIGGFDVENFANAGARAIGAQDPFADLGQPSGYDSNLGGQLDRFDAATGGTVGPGSNAVVFIGSNDLGDAAASANPDSIFFIFQLLAAGAATTSALLDVYEDTANTLDDAGFDAIFFGTLPVASFFPATALELPSFLFGTLDGIVEGLNDDLADLTDDLQGQNIDARIIDYAALSVAISEDPGGIGIVAPDDDLLFDGSAFDTDQVAFWDPLHPAEAIHQAWGAYGSFVMHGGGTQTLTDGADNFGDANSANAIFALGGDDTVNGARGDDIILAGSGNDAINANRGDDLVSGGSGNDLIQGKFGDDIIAGGSGDDDLRGEGGADVIFDGLGNDTSRGGGGDDIFVFVEAALENGVQDRDVFRGGSGFDTLYLVLDSASFTAFTGGDEAGVLSSIGVTARGIEAVSAIDGRGAVAAELGHFDWFQTADFWGLAPAPTFDVMV